jgi:hypothetical protein
MLEAVTLPRRPRFYDPAVSVTTVLAAVELVKVAVDTVLMLLVPFVT